MARNQHRPADDQLEIIAGPGHGVLGIFVTQLVDIRVVDSDESVAHAKSRFLCQTTAMYLEKYSDRDSIVSK